MRRTSWVPWIALGACLAACEEGPSPADSPIDAAGDAPARLDEGASFALDASTTLDAPVDAAVGEHLVDSGTGGSTDSSPSDRPSGPQPAGAVCELPDGSMLPCQGALLCCKPCCNGRPAVCTKAVENRAGIGVGQCPLPDLTIDGSALRASVGVGAATFSPSSCEAREACVDAPGVRNALHFEVTTPNIGSADLVLGSPLASNPLGARFVYSRCHQHYHFAGYALYQLIGADGSEVLRGKKRAFCLEDSVPVNTFPLPRAATPKYDCENQGIQAGWADSYFNGLSCQYMDITGVPPGTYKLRVTINPDHVFPELSYDNNTAETTVEIPAVAGGPTNACVGAVPGLNRECGWRKVDSYACTPATRISVGCGVECGLGTASGDPQIRVCPGEEACAWPGLGGNDDCTNSNDQHGARVTILCPPGGRITVLAGPSTSGDAESCHVEVR